MKLENFLRALVRPIVGWPGRIGIGNRILEVNNRVLWNKNRVTEYFNGGFRAQSLQSTQGTHKHNETVSLWFVRGGVSYKPHVLYVSVSGKRIPNHLLRHCLRKVKDKQFAELCILCAVVNEIIKYLRTRFESRRWLNGQ